MRFLKRHFDFPAAENLGDSRLVPAWQWHGHIAESLRAVLADSGVDGLRNTAAYISRDDNRPILCVGNDSDLQALKTDPDVLVYCYIEPLQSFDLLAESIARYMDLVTNSAQVQANANEYDTIAIEFARQAMVDQLASKLASILQAEVSARYILN
jgi:hypothetical protein